MRSLKFAILALIVSVISLSTGLVGNAATNLVQVIEHGSTNFVFSPTNLTISLGETVKWTNGNVTVHDTTQRTNLWPQRKLTNSPPGTFSFTFSNAGTYPYFCLTHSLSHLEQTGNVFVVSANVPPLVSITNPTNEANFFDPASFTIMATASDSDGIAQVQFFRGTNSLGTSTVSPYTNNVTALTNGTYALTAVATDNLGAKSTSSVVNVTVAVPPVITLGMLELTNGVFHLRVSGGSAGQTCVVDASDTLPNWSSIFTNIFPNTVCPSCPFIDVTNNVSGINQRFYRSRVFP